MEHQEFGPSWEKHKSAFQEQHPQLSDEDLAYSIDQEGELLKRLEAKTGKTKQEVYDWLHLMG